MIYTVTLNPSLDYVMYPKSLNIGETNRSLAESITVGGKGINVSIVLGNLGVESTALGFVAGFVGDAILSELEKYGINSDFLRLENGNSRINVKLKGEKETEINGNGPSISSADTEKLYKKLECLGKDDILVLAGSIPASLPEDTYEKIMQRLCKNGIRFVVDASGKLLENVLKYKPFLVKPNLDELSEICGKRPQDDSEISECAASLQMLGAQNVLVSMAGDGSLLLDSDGKTHRIHGVQGKVVNSVGAGDSMVAGFIAGYLETRDYSYAHKVGTAAGTATAFFENLADKTAAYKILALL